MGRVRQAHPALPVGFDTDVNGAALGEHGWGAARGLATFVYLTIGTGIGGGALIGGTPLHGLVHPEMGHLRIPHDWTEDPFPGVCPFHGDCWEGLASGPAIEQRWKTKAEHLPVSHPGWELEANYLALGIANLILTLSPQRIILGGGVIQREALVARVRALTSEVLNGYVQASDLAGGLGDYIVRPELGQDAGVLGAIALARAELERDLLPGAGASGDAGSHPA